MKNSEATGIILKTTARPPEKCLSCGTSENMGRRRYCSIHCRQDLRYQLDVRSGLLKALNVRYATFYFTDSLIILDLLPFDSRDIFSFIAVRRHNRKPSEDFSRLANRLGKMWWEEKRKTRKRYLASRFLLEIAYRSNNSAQSIKPLEMRKPTMIGKSLVFLKLSQSVLDSPELEQIIKRAFRQQAKKHHPDQGGDSVAFRRIYRAYEQILSWTRQPTFTKRRGFPDKWFYDGFANRWIQPAPRPLEDIHDSC